MRLLLSLLPLVAACAAWGSERVSAPHVEVSYTGISAEQAEGIAQTVSAARKVYLEEFGFDMPETVFCMVTCGAGQPTRLYTDGKDRIYLSLPSAEKLARPSRSGVFNLYGLCHEMGHVAMYRTLLERDWMTTAGAEGWAHYVGSVVVDEIFADRGEALWPDAYDYREDGLARLERQLAADAPPAMVRAAGAWRELESIVGRRVLAKVFAGWQGRKIDLTAPAEGLTGVLLEIAPEKRERIERWWASAGGVLAENREASGFARSEIKAAELQGRPMVLGEDDGMADGRRSIAGGGHARQFDSPGAGEWYLRAVRIHAARYGPVQAPATMFEVALCDSEMRPIATWSRPYGAVARGESRWVRLDVPPTRVPGEWYVCLNFRPTATSGIYMSFDSSTKGDSLVATPGRKGRELGEGDWMIRAEIDQAKGADALTEQ